MNNWTDRAFNIGCDARLAGKPLMSCPDFESKSLEQNWRRGWRQVQREWGSIPIRRKLEGRPYWHFKPLPEINYE